MEEARIHRVEGRLYVPYHNWYGRITSKFFIALRDEGRIMALHCRECHRTYMPPISPCPQCYSPLEEWRELSPTGTLLSYTYVNYLYSQKLQPRHPPYALGLIRLDGADTALCHLLGDISREELRMGLRVEAVFREQREGSILDIEYFRPLGKGQ
jgi:hypothetical protein